MTKTVSAKKIVSQLRLVGFRNMLRQKLFTRLQPKSISQVEKR